MNREQRRHGPPTVTVAYVHDREVTHSFHTSLVELYLHDLTHRQHIIPNGGFVRMRCSTGGLIEARNKTVAAFLSTGRDWMFLLDTDMGFRPDTVDRLLDAADPVDRPIVGGLCFAQREIGEDGYGGYRCIAVPTIFDWIDGKFAAVRDYPRDTVLECQATGAACILIHRTVFEQIADYSPEPRLPPNGPRWYDRIPGPDGGFLGEDISFCVRARAAGIPIYVHTGVKTTHMKVLWLAEDDYDREQFVKENASGDYSRLGSPNVLVDQ